MVALAVNEPLVPTTVSRKLPTGAFDVAETVSVPDVVPSLGGVSVPGPATVTPVGIAPTHAREVLTGAEK